MALARAHRRDLPGGVLLRAAPRSAAAAIARRPTRPPASCSPTTSSASYGRHRPSAELGGGHCFCTDAHHMSTTTDGCAGTRGRGSTPARRLPVGVEVVGPDTVHARVWAPAAREVEHCAGRPRGRPCPPKPTATSRCRRKARAGDRYGFRVNKSERLYPDPASRFQPDGPHGLSEIVDPGAFAWTDRGWTGVVAGGSGPVRASYRHVYAAGDVDGRGSGTRGTGAARDHRHGVDAGRRVRRPFRVGLRRRRPVRAVASLRTAGRSPRVRRSRARGRHRRHPRRRLQPPRSGRQLPAGVLGGLLHRSRTRTSGAMRSTSTATTPVRSGNSSSPTPATGSTSSTSTGCGSTRRSRSSTARHRNVMAEIGDRVREKRRAPAGRSSSPRTSRRTRGSCGRRRRGALASTRCGTTTFTTARWWRSRDAPRRTTATRAGRRRSSCRPPSTATCFRAALPLAAAAPRARRGSTSRRADSSSSCRTTIRWPIRRAGCAVIS